MSDQNPLSVPDPAVIAKAALDFGKDVVNAVGGAVGEVAKNAGQISKNAEDVIKAIVKGMDDTADKAQKLVTDMFDKLAAPPPPPALDPTAVLTAISAALSKAEDVLNNGIAGGKGDQARPSNLVISSGTVDVEFHVQIPGAPIGAAARIHLEISPKPYN